MPSEPPQSPRPQDPERNLIDAARRDAAVLREGERPAVPLSPDRAAFPGYDILRELRRGGQGVVYEAFQRSTSRKVAIKVMLAGPLASDAARLRFEREIRLLANLRHPNIVVIHDGGVSESHPYFVMDYISGEHLHHYCKSRSLDTLETVRLFRQVVDAVAFAHKKGVVHRDLKPSNILVDQNGVPYVLDFGLAKMASRVQHDPAATAVSRTGEVLGTPRYMSPEQRIGDSDSVDSRTDVHALGVILFELLTGSHPKEVDAAVSAPREAPRSALPQGISKLRPDAGSDLERIVLKAMSNDPGRRYPSANEMMQELDLWLSLRGQSPTPGTIPERSRAREPWRARRYLLLTAGLVLFACAWFTGQNMRGMNGPHQPGSTDQAGNPVASTTGVSASTASHVSPEAPDAQLSIALDYAKRNLPLRGLSITQIPGGSRIRISGYVLNDAELGVLRNRIQSIADIVELEVRANPEAVRLLVQQSLAKTTANQVKVRLEGATGREHLNVELSLPAEDAAPRDLAKSYVFDAAYVRVRTY